MSKFGKLVLILIIVSLIFHKKIIIYYYVNKLSNWVERPVLIDQINFNYSGLVKIKNIRITNFEKFYYQNIFEADEININIKLNSLLTDLIIVKDLNIKNPIFYLDIKIDKDRNLNSISNKSLYEDNIGLAKKINENIPDKIWPKKKRDINFLIIKSNIEGAKAKIRISNITYSPTINLSNMNFSNFGNEKKYQHYKDILRIMLFDVFARTENIEVKKILKQIYKF